MSFFLSVGAGTFFGRAVSMSMGWVSFATPIALEFLWRWIGVVSSVLSVALPLVVLCPTLVLGLW